MILIILCLFFVLILDIGAGGLINPNKNYAQVFKEADEGHPLYVRSHADYYPLERVCRSYTNPSFGPQVWSLNKSLSPKHRK